MDNHTTSTENNNPSAKKKHTRSFEKFSQKEVTFNDAPLFFPEGFEKFFLIIYMIAIPYIFGVLFMLFYVSWGNIKLFLSIYEKSIFASTWAIGYEILAVITLLFIFKSAMSFNTGKYNEQKGFRRP